MESEKRRYVGIDLGKRTYSMAVVGKKDTVNFSNGKTSPEGRISLCGKLEKTDMVALEAGNLAFELAKEIIDRVGCEVVVLNPGRLAIIWASVNKTDKEDALKLAHHIQETKKDRLPIVPLPSDQEMRRRKLIAGHERAKKFRTQMLNVLHGVFLRQGITTITKKDLATKERREAAVIQLNGLEAEEAAWTLACIDRHEQRLVELDKRMAEERKGDEQIARLQQVAGVGPMVALAFVAYVGDVNRFENGAQLSNYLGLCPKVDISGTIVRYGRITKRGNTYLRSLLVQASWALIRSKNGGALKERYAYMTVTKNMGKRRSIVAIARRLAQLLYTLLKNESDYETRRFNPPPSLVRQAMEVA
jgi:transposase